MRTFLSFVFVVSIAAGADRTYQLPCEITSVAPSGDGKLVWVSCFTPDSKYRSPGVPAAEDTRPSILYMVDSATGRLTDLLHGVGRIQIVAAPVGAKAAIVVPGVITSKKGSAGKVLLYVGSREISAPPIGPEYITWSADASRIYFHAGSTIQADAWNILGVARLDTLVVSRTKLSVATEDVNICRQSGHLFAGVVPFDNGRALPYPAAEYDPDLHYVGRNARIPPGSFSATCRYVATPSSFPHGPAPWRVVATATGLPLMQFEFEGEGRKEEFEFRSWNPAQEDLLIRFRYRASGPNDVKSDLQVFDVLRRLVIDSVPDFEGEAAWSSDGKSLILARGHSLVFHEVSPR